MLKDNASIRGIVNLVLRDQYGRVKQHKTIRNAVTEDGIAHIIGRMIDTNQDRKGSGTGAHEMPRMMSHMAIGTGVASPANAGASSVISANTTNRFLQTEVGTRVQLMKDTSLASDYTTFDIALAGGNLTATGGGAFNNAVVGESFITMPTSAATSGTLRVGMSVTIINETFIPANTTIGAITNVATGSLAGTTKIDLLVAGNPSVITGGNASIASGSEIGAQSVRFQYTDILTSLGGGTNPHPFTAVADPANTFTDYKTGLRGKIGGYYDTTNTPADIAANSKLAPFFGESTDKPSADFTQFGTDLDGVFQGTRVGGSIVADTGTSTEGYHPDEHDFGSSALTDVSAGGAVGVKGSKKTGNRIIFIATFKEENPNVATTLVREAGVFNCRTTHPSFGGVFTDRDGSTVVAIDGSDAGYTALNLEGQAIDALGGGTVLSFSKGSPRSGAIEQTMLCRTTFDVVTKAQLDTLQITWSVQLSDQTP
jgi:hypothetical protein